ncbi:MAG: DUF5683 domain-containing protein [Ignavibacteriae bacterium]|nr:DUF5683 domain-containing protein [Ignavibacteriota bacterium]
MTRRRLIFFSCCLSLTFLLQYSFAQQASRHSSVIELWSVLDSTEATSIQTKSTTTAVLLSAVLPGAGQVYTERYWKIPIIWGFGVYFGGIWIKANRLYNDAADRYAASLAGGGNGDGNARYARDFYRDERDRFVFYLAITYVLNLVDAYVGASLYDFDVSDDLGGSAQLRISIPIR